jgi:hypothetical protein
MVTATLKPTTALHKAYYRTIGNQLPTTPKPTDPSWVEGSPTEFAAADYVAVDSDDASRTARLASATIATRWCASSEEFTFDLSAYPGITNIEIMWDGYVKTVDVIDLEAFFKKSGAGAWTNVGAVPEADGAGWEIDVNDVVCYTAAGIYKIGVLVVSTKVITNTTANTYSDALQIIVTYTPVAGGALKRLLVGVGL